MPDNLHMQFEKIDSAIRQTAFDVKKQYDQSSVGKLQKEWTLWAKFWSGFSKSCVFLYKKLIWPITWRVWRAVKWISIQYRNLWLNTTYKADQYGTMRFARTRGGLMIVGSAVSIYSLYILLVISASVPWYILTVKHDEVLYLSNHSAVEGHSANRIKINDVYEITGCEVLDCSDQDSVSFRVEASWFNEAYSILHNHALYYPDYVAAAVSPVVNKCTITSYGIRRKFLVRYWEMHPDILSVRCTPVGLENEKSIHNKDYR